MRVAAILQARMGSTRLPGKIVKEVLGKELILYEIERLKRCHLIDDIIVATTTDPKDDYVEKLCRKYGVVVFRGSEEDVLSRYVEAAKTLPAEVIVRVTADCPLIDPEVTDRVIKFFLENLDRCDYVSNTRKLTYPRGFDVEVFSKRVLLELEKSAIEPYDREHVTPYIYRHPEIYRVCNVASERDLSKYRLTVDTPEDYALIKLIIEELYPINPNFSLVEVINLLEQHPDWVAINASIKQKP